MVSVHESVPRGIKIIARESAVTVFRRTNDVREVRKKKKKQNKQNPRSGWVFYGRSNFYPFGRNSEICLARKTL